MFDDKERSSINVFNMSLATLERIDILLRKLTEQMITGNTLLIQRYIIALYKELFPFLKPEEKKESRKKFNDILLSITILDGSKYSIKNGTNNAILEFDFYIREQLYKKGLLMAKGDDPSIALG